MRNDRNDFFGTHLSKPSPLAGLTIPYVLSDTVLGSEALIHRYNSSVNLIICSPIKYEVRTGDEAHVNLDECKIRGIKVFKGVHPHAHGAVITMPGETKVLFSIAANHPALKDIIEDERVPATDWVYLHLFRYWMDFFYTLVDKESLPIEHSHGDLFLDSKKVGLISAQRPEWSPYPVKMFKFGFKLNTTVDTSMINALLKVVEQPVYTIDKIIGNSNIVSSFEAVFGCKLNKITLTAEDKVWLNQQPEYMTLVKND